MIFKFHGYHWISPRSSSSVFFMFFHSSSPSCNTSGSSFHRWRTRHRNGGKKKSRCTWARGSEGRLVHLWCIFDSTKTSCLFCLSSLESTMWVSNPQVYSIQITKGSQVEVRTSLDRYLSGGKCAGVVHQRKDTTPNLQIRALRYLKIHCQNLTSQTQPW